MRALWASVPGLRPDRCTGMREQRLQCPSMHSDPLQLKLRVYRRQLGQQRHHVVMIIIITTIIISNINTDTHLKTAPT